MTLIISLFADNPEVVVDLPESKTVVNTGDLSVSCSFRAKPAVSVSWMLDDSSELLPEIFECSSSSHEDGKLTVSQCHK